MSTVAEEQGVTGLLAELVAALAALYVTAPDGEAGE